MAKGQVGRDFVYYCHSLEVKTSNFSLKVMNSHIKISLIVINKSSKVNPPVIKTLEMVSNINQHQNTFYIKYRFHRKNTYRRKK